jgi:hypothetical protein
MKSHEQKVKEGIERNAFWQSLTPAEQMRNLDSRLGKGIGAVRQRAMIAKRMEAVTK